MATATHEIFLRLVNMCIMAQIQKISDGQGKVSSFARDVRDLGHIQYSYPKRDGLPGEESKHCPDAQFAYRLARYPGVIMEVSYSQKRKDLKRLANTYLGDSSFSVQAVVAFDIEYGSKASNMATLSVWRVLTDQAASKATITPTVDNELFRDDEGGTTNSSGLLLRLSDFVPPPYAQELLGGQDRDIIVTGQQLCQFLNEAETLHRLDPTTQYPGVDPTGVNFKRLSSSPPDTNASHDEARFADQQKTDADRATAADPDWENLSEVPQEPRQETPQDTPQHIRTSGR